MYQGAVFYVQLQVYAENFKECKVGESCALKGPKNSYMVWVYIEVFCFYLYMLSSAVYIIYH